MRFSKKNFVSGIFLVSFWVFSFVIFGQTPACAANVSTASSDEEQQKNKKIEDTKENIEKLEEKIKKESKQLPVLQNNLQFIQNNLSKTQKSIQTTQSNIDQTSRDIQKKASEVQSLNNQLTLQKSLLSGLVRSYYYLSQNPLDRFEEPTQTLSLSSDSVLSLQGKINEMLEGVSQIKEKIADEKKDLEEYVDEKEKLLDLHQEQQTSLLEDKGETQQQINRKQATIGELQAKVSKLKSDLSSFLGKSYNAKDIEDAAEFAAKATGIRKDFLMGMLVVESDLGRYTGGCDYKESRMSGTRLELFKEIADELGHSYKKLKLSCPPKNYTGTGGAMGVAQFMSDTWMSYKSRIAKVTGHNPPDPWSLTDGVAAMAIKLSAVPGVTEHKRSGECNAAKLYLSGSTSSKYEWYCERVLYWSGNYESKL